MEKQDEVKNLHKSKRLTVLLSTAVFTVTLFGSVIASYFNKSDSFTNLSYEELSSEFISSQHDMYVTSRDDSLYNNDDNYNGIIANFADCDKVIAYSNGAVRSFLDNGSILIYDADFNEVVHSGVRYGSIYADDSGLTVFSSVINANSNLGGVYDILFPSGERIWKEFSKEQDAVDCSYRLISTNGEEIYFDCNGNMVSALNTITNETIPFDEDGNAVITYGNGEVIKKICPRKNNSVNAEFATGHMIKWYDKNGELLYVCSLEQSDTICYYGMINKIDDNNYKCIWNDGTVTNYTKEVINNNTVDIITSIEYINGRSIEISDDKITIKEYGESIGYIPIDSINGYRLSTTSDSIITTHSTPGGRVELELIQGMGFVVYREESGYGELGIYLGSDLKDDETTYINGIILDKGSYSII